MSNYVFGSGLSYQQYLQAKSFVSDITSSQQGASKAIGSAIAKQSKAISMAVSTQMRQILASQEALAREQIRASEQISRELSHGFETLSWQVEDVSRGISDLSASFHWGFSEMIGRLGGMNDALQDLLRIAKTPVQTVAYNHFEIARDAVRQGLYGEALEELQKAIAGDHTSAGYKLEWRFHQLVGTIHLGSVTSDISLIDLAKAEERFLLAARYARSDYPKDAAQAFLAAGWAAYCQGKMVDSLSHTEDALRLNPKLGEALFQLAKVRMAIDAPDQALPALASAIEVDKRYALKAAGDGDFQKHEKSLLDFIEALRREKVRLLLPPIEAALRDVEFWLSHDRQATKDPVVVSARTACAELAQLPLFDILSKTEDLREFPERLGEQALRVRIVLRTVFAGSEYSAEEPFTEDPGPDAGLFRRLAGPRRKVRTITRKAGREALSFRDGKGVERSRMDFVHVRPGRFDMRIPNEDHSESVRRKGRITRGFLLATTPVTEEQYRSVFSESTVSPSDLPVTNVNWIQAVAYCNALSRLAGIEGAYTISGDTVQLWNGLSCGGYRLPTEAEWEYACLVGRQMSEFDQCYFDSITDVAWFEENAGGKKHPVASKAANVFGLHDMLGNVQEWVFDWYTENEYWYERPEIDPTGPSTGERKTVRGGSYLSSAQYLRQGGDVSRNQ